MTKSRRKAPRYKRDVEETAKSEAEPHRIPADLSKQASNNSYSPKLFYVDIPFTCRDCGRLEVWTAEQQQWWYEVAKESIYSVAVRCRSCRQARSGTTEEG